MLPAELNAKAIKSIEPSMRYAGGDYAVWQKNARKKLHELLGLDKFERCDPVLRIESVEEKDSYTETWMTFNTEPGYSALCVRLEPKTRSKGFMICLQGHSTGMRNSLGINVVGGEENEPRARSKDFAVQAVNQGYTAMALEQRCFGERGGTPYPDCTHASMLSLLRGRTMIGERVWDVSRLVELINDSFNPDGLPIYVMGNSGGGTATVYSAAANEKLAGAIPSCAVCSWRESIAYTWHCVCNYVPGIANFFDMGDIAGLIAPRIYVQVNGREDDIFLLHGAEECFETAKKVFEAAGASDKCALVVGEGGHRFYPDPAWKVFADLTAKQA
ncbi:MAG: lysophospholipase [Clostridia bacterium]|nr:lysophospholipase [Clostridia bacterium]